MRRLKLIMPMRSRSGDHFNPDLPRRLQRGFPLTPYNRATFYGGDVAGLPLSRARRVGAGLTPPSLQAQRQSMAPR
jgi:hypothetical protein